MHKTLLKTKEALEVALYEIVDKKCVDKMTSHDVCLACEIVEGIHNINKIIVDDSMRLALYEEIHCMKDVKNIEEMIDIYDEFMHKREKEGIHYKKESEHYRKGGEY